MCTKNFDLPRTIIKISLPRRHCPRRDTPLGIHGGRNDFCSATIPERRRAGCPELRVSRRAERNRRRGGQDRGRRDPVAQAAARILTNRPRRHRPRRHFFRGYDHHRLHSLISDGPSTIPTIPAIRSRSVRDSLLMRPIRYYSRYCILIKIGLKSEFGE